MMRNLLSDPTNPHAWSFSAAPASSAVTSSTNCAGQNIPTVSVSSKDIDLSAPQSIEQLKSLLRKDDSLVFASCLTPDKGKDLRTAVRNFAMGENVGTALQAAGCATSSTSAPMRSTPMRNR